MCVTMKEKYEDPKLLVTLLDTSDIITTSGESGSLGWDSDKNIDSGGWT